MRNIVIAGPMGAGKSRISRALSIKLDLPLYSADKLRWYYFAKHGFNEVNASQMTKSGDIEGAHLLHKKHELLALESMLAEFSDGIMDLGGGFLDCTSEEDEKRARAALKAQKKVVCLLPSENKIDSMLILNSRLSSRYKIVNDDALNSIFRLNDRLLSLYLSTDIPMIRITTAHKSESQIAEEIERKIYGP
ncbi:MAG: hypothetical protein M3Q07_26555 [Pseudobdellovibrionaceae bacterium]|nr:hypothetical protein [Pseudobdellovibrionaceae bacterium]